MLLECVYDIGHGCEPIHIECEVYDTALEGKRLDSHDFTYFGYNTLDELKESNDNDVYVTIVQTMPYSIEVTKNRVLSMFLGMDKHLIRTLALLVWTKDHINKSLLHILYEVCQKEEENADDYEDFGTFRTVDDVLNFLEVVE